MSTSKPPIKTAADLESRPKKPAKKKAGKSRASYGDDITIAPDMQAVDPRLLELLICPKTRGPLTYDRNLHELISKKAKLAYSIRDGVPIMLPEEARKL